VIYDPVGEKQRITLLFTHREAPPESESTVIETLGELGDEGWEMVTATSTSGLPSQLWLKRPLD
jgi:hypothetical protein